MSKHGTGFKLSLMVGNFWFLVSTIICPQLTYRKGVRESNVYMI